VSFRTRSSLGTANQPTNVPDADTWLTVPSCPAAMRAWRRSIGPPSQASPTPSPSRSDCAGLGTLEQLSCSVQIPSPSGSTSSQATVQQVPPLAGPRSQASRACTTPSPQVSGARMPTTSTVRQNQLWKLGKYLQTLLIPVREAPSDAAVPLKYRVSPPTLPSWVKTPSESVNTPVTASIVPERGALLD